MRIMVDPRRHTVLVWAMSPRGYRLYVPIIIGRKVHFRKRLDFKNLEDSRINEDARSHWERLAAFEHPASISPGELARFIGGLVRGSPDDTTEYVGQLVCPTVSGLRVAGHELYFDFTC